MEPTSTPSPVTPAKKSGTFTRVLMTIFGIIVLLSGIAQISKGMKGLKGGGGNSPEVKRLGQESDTAAEEAKRTMKEATAQFQSLMNSVDTAGLPAFRANEKEAAAKTNELYSATVSQFRLAAKKLEESRAANKNEKLAPFLASKGRSYELFADAFAVNQEIIAMLLDESITSVETLLPKVNEAAARRSEIEKKAQVANQESSDAYKALEAEAAAKK
jgi:hypothetical protein